MGIAGASLSTLIVHVFECIINFGYLTFLEKDAHYRLPNLFMKTGELLPEYIKISISVLISDGMMGFGNNAFLGLGLLLGIFGAVLIILICNPAIF